MIKEITVNGITINIDDEFFNDMEVLDILTDIEEQKDDAQSLIAFSKYMRKLYGREQLKIIYEALRDESGRIPLDRIREFNDSVTEEIGKKK